uniref:M96 mating-specific protein family n=1 Tax=Hyaloperonospora arabidopsidis (strain Emoy2) TaxID=559515 RepID=M4B1D4_HYAAE
MAFLEDDDAVRAFEAALSFVEQYSTDPTSIAPTGASSASFSSSLASAIVDDIELLSPSVTPFASPLPSACVSPESLINDSLLSPANTVNGLSNGAKMENLSPPTTPGHKIKAVMGRARRKKPTSSGPKKPVTRGDPNRARNERKIELAFLREKVAQLELELTALMLHPRSQTRALRHEGEKRQVTKQEAVLDSTMSVYDPVQIPTVWKEVAGRQRRRREKAERENVRLKLILEHQIKMAKGLESLLQKRAKQQVTECLNLSQTKKSKYSQGRTFDFRADVSDFEDLLKHLDRAYKEVDEVFAANGMSKMETTHRDARMREGADGMYLDIYANKVMPFGMRATAQAVWNHFKGAEKHRGNMYEGKVAKHLATPDTPETIIEDFAKEFFADSARADFHAKQVLRRYVEEDREIVIWVASVVPLEFDDKCVKGLGFRHQGYALTKKAKASTPNREFSLLQLCSLVSPEKEDHTVYDSAAVRALTDFMLGTVAGNITASQELIENVLMDQSV